MPKANNNVAIQKKVPVSAMAHCARPSSFITSAEAKYVSGGHHAIHSTSGS
ncbi:MAG: hypothetical protein P9L99_06885 [Candidatus Lernaella stagnicola]|nr:hypothetical protein [Candidatus Lernaella stagnicola]